MTTPKKPKAAYVPQYSPNFVVGYSFLHHVLVDVSEAFMAGKSKP